MHEVDMTKCLLLSMRQWKEQHAPATPRVDQVHLQVGSFTCVEPDQLVTTWRAAVRGSWLDGAELAIETVPLVGRCLACNSTYTPDPEQAYRSPCCDHPLEEIVSGRELRIRSVTYVLSDVASPSHASAAPDPFATASAV
jgi:hydrogenase nickel incorporation protein HypA/HybF